VIDFFDKVCLTVILVNCSEVNMTEHTQQHTGPGPGPAAGRHDIPDRAEAAAALHGEHCDAIRVALRDYGPQTIHELAACTGLTHVQIARRLPESPALFQPTAALRAGPSGRRCRVWRAL
jgi:hypothetical protein